MTKQHRVRRTADDFGDENVERRRPKLREPRPIRECPVSGDSHSHQSDRLWRGKRPTAVKLVNDRFRHKPTYAEPYRNGMS